MGERSGHSTWVTHIFCLLRLFYDGLENAIKGEIIQMMLLVLKYSISYT